jgi:hypothetical protein
MAITLDGTTGIVASGNIQGAIFKGDGSLLTGIDATAIQNGTTSVATAANADITLTRGGTLIATITADTISPGADNTQDLGTTSLKWAEVHATTYYGSGSQLTGIDATAITSGTSDMTVISSGGNIMGNIGGATVIEIHSGGINNKLSNGTGNLGETGSAFNTVHAKATSAQYADLAEKYTADKTYPTGTVVVFGGDEEVTACDFDDDHRVAGVISDKPSYLMNADLKSEHVATVALVGRVPVKVIGPEISKGDILVTGADGHARVNNNASAGRVLGKSLENFSGRTGTVEAVIGVR